MDKENLFIVFMLVWGLGFSVLYTIKFERIMSGGGAPNMKKSEAIAYMLLNGLATILYGLALFFAIKEEF